MNIESTTIQGSQEWNILPGRASTLLSDIIQKARIIATEVYATLRHILPASILWVWRTRICNEITTIPLKITSGNVSEIGYLNIHGKLKIQKEQVVTPLILSHGDYGHPFSMLHLADVANDSGIPTFSLYIPGIANDNHFNLHNELLGLTIDKIRDLIVSEGGDVSGVIGVGHSKGAILLAHRFFVHEDNRIHAVCSINGRLKVPQEEDCPHQDLKEIVKRTYQGILKHSDKPLTQIVAKNDWNASRESIAVRPQENCYIVPGMHLSGLYSKETKKYFTEFVKPVIVT